MKQPNLEGGARGPSEDEAAIERQRALAEQLRAMFEDVVNEPLPDPFLSLIDKLGEGEESS